MAVGCMHICGKPPGFLRNIGNAKFPNLTTERVFTDENPPTHEQGTDRPGRGFKRAATNRRSSMETALGDQADGEDG
jgi:hypothetical protein